MIGEGRNSLSVLLRRKTCFNEMSCTQAQRIVKGCKENTKMRKVVGILSKNGNMCIGFAFHKISTRTQFIGDFDGLGVEFTVAGDILDLVRR